MRRGEEEQDDDDDDDVAVDGCDSNNERWGWQLRIAMTTTTTTTMTTRTTIAVISFGRVDTQQSKMATTTIGVTEEEEGVTAR
jgi:hypothetical protein